MVKLTMNSHKIELVARIDGIPWPKYRWFAVTNKKTGKPIVHDENKHHVESFRKALREAVSDLDLGWIKNQPMELSLRFFFGRPKPHYAPQGTDALVLRPDDPVYVCKVPDTDNLVKLVMEG